MPAVVLATDLRAAAPAVVLANAAANELDECMD
jgi:hypothetical protein